MNNIVKFPKPKILITFRNKTNKIKEVRSKSSPIKNIFIFLYFIVQWPIFLLMYWLRLPIIFLCNILSLPMMFTWLFAWYAFPDKTNMIWGFAIVSLLAFSIGWIYDFILMLISPQNTMTML